MATKKKTKKRSVRPTKKKKPVAKAKAKTKAKAKVKTRAKAKPAVKRAKAKRPAPKKAKKVVRRRDGAGHLDPRYAATLREKSDESRTHDADQAFVGGSRSKDDLAEEMGETWVASATSGEDENQDVLEQEVPEEMGGPFVETSANQEFAHGTDPSNPKGSSREPFPKT
jgi:hypothetical protein